MKLIKREVFIPVYVGVQEQVDGQVRRQIVNQVDWEVLFNIRIAINETS